MDVLSVRNLGRLCPHMHSRLRVEMQPRLAPPFHLSINTLDSSAASGFWCDLPLLGVFARHRRGRLSSGCFYGAAVS